MTTFSADLAHKYGEHLQRAKKLIAKGDVPGVVMRFDWRGGFLKEILKKW